MSSVAMTIAGSDSGGGAGIQADLKTFQELGTFGTSALTAVTAQNTLGVHGVYPIEADGITAQIRAVMGDFRVGAIKTGMLFSAEIIHAVSSTLKSYDATNLIIDPVMIAKGGASLLLDEAVQAMIEDLVPMATVITPNIPEAEVLTGKKIESQQDLVDAGHRILDMGAKSVVMKGGHFKTGAFAEDFFFSADGEHFTLRSPWVETKDTHGTGCTFSAAITAWMAQGKSVADSVLLAKQFIHAAISDGLHLGAGHGPTNHWAFNRHSEEMGKLVSKV